MLITLYIKTHNTTGLKYFGKTKLDVYKYKGSGKHWKRHLKKHGNDVTTEIYAQFEETDPKLEECALKFSEDNNIVESKEWANMKPENGLDGGSDSRCYTEDVRKKMSELSKGRVYDDEYKRNMSLSCKGINKGDKNGMKGYTFSDDAMDRIIKAHLGVKRSKDTVEKIRKSALNRDSYKIVECPHCHKTGKENAMKRWHFDRCILVNPEANSKQRELVTSINKKN